MREPFPLFLSVAFLALAAVGCGPRPSPTATPVRPTATPMPPTATPLPATDTVCAAGCDFATIQAAIDDAGTANGAIIEITDPIHTEAGIVVNKDVTIRGLGAEDTIVQAHEIAGEALDRVFLVEEGANLILEGMTIRHGKPSIEEHGGGIMNHGTLTLRDCAVSDNIAIGGGGICNSGALKLVNSSVSNNAAVDTAPPGIFACGGGGGIRSGKGTLALINSTVSGNQAGTRYRGAGGGIRIGCGCTAVFTNSTISDNSSVHSGGGISVVGTLQLVNCTISNNTTIGKGEGICVQGRLDYENTLIANNPGNGGDCAIGKDAYGKRGTIGGNSNNLVGDGSCDSDHSGDPMLGPLTDNGGATWTHALLPGSPAIDAIPVISCTVPTDQRGVPRPVVQTSPDTPCDIGAFEWRP
jgi:predicted outer membrane repeat protein